MSKQTRPSDPWEKKPARQRLGNLLVLGYLVGAISSSEEKWLRNLIDTNWSTKPTANGAEYGE